jgi:hypothetical protein
VLKPYFDLTPYTKKEFTDYKKKAETGLRPASATLLKLKPETRMAGRPFRI